MNNNIEKQLEDLISAARLCFDGVYPYSEQELINSFKQAAFLNWCREHENEIEQFSSELDKLQKSKPQSQQQSSAETVKSIVSGIFKEAQESAMQSALKDVKENDIGYDDVFWIGIK